MRPKINPALLAQIAAGATLKTDTAVSDICDIHLWDIVTNPHQPRLEIAPVELRELAESIRLHGLIQPIAVARTDAGYQLISGHRRLEAHKILGRDTVRANIIDADEDDLAVLALIENVQRSDLHPLEVALAISKEPFVSMRDDEISAALGYSVTKLRNTRSTLKLDIMVQRHIIENKSKIGVEILVELQKIKHRAAQWNAYLNYLKGYTTRDDIRVIVSSQNARETTKTPPLMSRHANTIKIDCNAIVDIHMRSEFDRELAILLAKYKSAGGSTQK